MPQHVFEARGEKAIELMDSRIVETADTLKEYFPKGTITINNWLWGGARNWSGLRTPGSPYYRPYSQHSFGRAIDALFSDYDIAEIRKFIRDNPDKFPYINFIEMNVSWLHADCRNCKRITAWTP